MERTEMATETETQREIRDGFVRIANKWLRGREEIARLQGSSFVIAGQSAAQRQMLNLMAEVTRDMERFLGAGHSPDVLEAIGEVFYMWKNSTSRRDTVELASSHVKRSTVN
jgi:GGDEF domain-containing protein